MKKIYYSILFILFSVTGFAQSTVTTSVFYTGFQACGGCTVCGMDYWCFNTIGSYCGNTGPCGTKTFIDPVPAGNVVTNIQVQYYTAECSGDYLSATIDGNTVPTVYEGYSGCPCSINPCGVSASTSANYPCGMPGYVYGGVNTLQLCTGASICVNEIVLIITYYNPGQINPTITASGPTNFCQGGSVVLNAGAGYSAYSWNTGANTQTINVTTSGTYVVTVTSITGCTTGSASMTVNVHANPNPSITASGPLSFCQGGSVVLNAGAGYSNYSWNTGANTQTINVTTSGTYAVTVTDANGCTGTTSTTVNVNANPNPSITASGPTNFCQGGSVVLNAGAGYTSYSWSNGGTSQTTTVNTSGTYVVTVTNASGCTASTSTTVNVYANPTPSITSISPTTFCQGGNVVLNAGAGYSSYTWSTGSHAQTITATTAGTYSVTVTNANGCTGTASVVVGVNANPTPTITAISPTTFCQGGNVVLNAGAGYIGYSWSNSAITQTITATTSGTYSVTVTNSNGCTGTATISVTSYANPTVSATGTQAGCSVANGTATANPSGGTPGYTYSWNTAPVQNTQTASNLSGGTYVVTITDAHGCTAQTPYTVTSTNAPTVTASGTQAGCSVSNGTATANPSGGTPSYTYSWTPTNQTTQIATGLGAGTYTILLTDANGCSRTNTVSITATSAPTVTASATPATCATANGTATANVSSGTPGYIYSWNTVPVQSTQIATGLTNGTYSVLISDANGCTTSTTVAVNAANGPTVTATATSNVSCNGGNNGNAIANVTGGTPTYTYVWNNGQTTQTATGLSFGTYTVIVHDANNCSFVTTASVSQPSILSAPITPANVSCNGGNNATATVNPTGGTPGYTYSWNTAPVQTTQTASGLSFGNYSVTTTDANGCTATTTVGITQPTALAAAFTPSNVSCNGGNNGSATVTPSGGTPGYTYSWAPTNQSTQAATGLSAGSYSVLVTDANGCTSTSTVSISQPTALTTSVTSQSNVLCNGGNNGSATITPSGGTPGYTYTWSPTGGNAQTASNLLAGNYSVTVADAHGCTAIVPVTITQPTVVITATSSQTNVLCNGGNNASATVTPSGGTPGYTYVWNNGQTNANATGLTAGNYTVTITDANGCTKNSIVSITQPAALAAGTVPAPVTCNGGSNGSATANPTGGTPGYTYVWNNGQTNASATGLAAGNYNVIITDANGCTTQAAASITQPPPLGLSVTGNDTICKGDNTTLTANPSGGTPAYTYTWMTAPQQNGASIVVNPTSSSNYSVAISDANGCTSLVQTYNVLVLPSPSALFDTASSGTFSSSYVFTDLSTPSVTVTGWNWNFGDGSGISTVQNPAHTFPGAGTYTVTEVAFNKFGCPDTFRLTVTIGEGIIIPNVFTPDGDGINDVWYIPNSGMKEFSVEIFDRWGAKVFQTTADEIRWDGRSSSGQLLSDGTYFYNLRAVLKSGSNGKDYSTSGYVTLFTKGK